MTRRPGPVAILAVAAAAAALLAATDAAAGGKRDVPDVTGMTLLQREIRLQGESQVNLSLEFAAGQMWLARGKEAGTIRLELYRAKDVAEPEISYEKRGRYGEVRLRGDETGEGIRLRSRSHAADSTDDDKDGFEFDLEDYPQQVWMVSLPPGVPFSIQLETGASRCDLDLSGVRVADLDVEAGAGEVDIRFDTPNPEPGGHLRVQGGACKVRAVRLGNGRFRTLSLEGGLGDFLLDFRGEPDRDMRAELKVGLGRLRVRLPEDLGVKLDCSRREFSGVTVEGLERVGDMFLSKNYGRAKHELVLDLSPSLGIVEVEVLD